MNYLSHAYRFLNDPYFLAGAAVPDWLGVMDRSVRASSKRAAMFVECDRSEWRSLARGIVQHHFDDRWFHNTLAFAETCSRFTRWLGEALPADRSFRTSFVAHILVEILLDSTLTNAEPHLLDEYYRLLHQVDPHIVQGGVNAMANKPTDRIAELLPRFLSERFLYDYSDDAKLLTRLNQVMRRVGLEPLPVEIGDLFPRMRVEVARRREELLTPTPTEADRAD